MGSIPRKDYGEAAIVKDSNPVMKRVNSMNAPHSIQATGADKMEGKVVAITTVAEFNALTPYQRVLLGNREGYIKTVTASTSLVYAVKDQEKEEELTTLTVQQVIDSGNLFILDERP